MTDTIDHTACDSKNYPPPFPDQPTYPLLIILRHTFHVPSRFHPAYSLLGRGLRRLVGDARRAEALFLVTLSMVALGLVLAQYFAWMWLQATIMADPLGPVAVGFWVGQVGTVFLAFAVCVVGFTPPIAVTLTPTEVHLRRGSKAHVLATEAITSVASISPLLYYRHYARYAATEVFINRMTPQVLMLHTSEAPVALGLLPKDHEAAVHFLERQAQQAPTFEASIAHVA